MYQSKGGKISLIKSRLAHLPIYNMSLFLIPSLVMDFIEKMERDFLFWDGWKESLKPHLIAWKDICKPLKFGGLLLNGFRIYIVFYFQSGCGDLNPAYQVFNFHFVHILTLFYSCNFMMKSFR